MSDIRERIADTVRQHRPGASIVAYTCMCGVPWTSEHVADAVIEALGGLREVSGPQYVCDRLYGGCPARQVTGRCEHVEYVRKYVLETPWERIEEDG